MAHLLLHHSQFTTLCVSMVNQKRIPPTCTNTNRCSTYATPTTKPTCIFAQMRHQPLKATPPRSKAYLQRRSLIKFRTGRLSAPQNTRSQYCVTTHTITPPLMLFQAARPTVGEEESTRATYVAQLHNNKKHNCNAETQENTESTDQDYLKTAKTHVP